MSPPYPARELSDEHDTVRRLVAEGHRPRGKRWVYALVPAIPALDRLERALGTGMPEEERSVALNRRRALAARA